jgi:hypothetical protein
MSSLVSQGDLDKINKITRLHDEAFWHLHEFDSHAKSSDGRVSISLNMGTVWDRENGNTYPRIEVSIYSYVVATEGGRTHEFESIDEALAAVTEWHSKALAYNPTPEEIAEVDAFAIEMWDAIKDRVIVIDASKKDGE